MKMLLLSLVMLMGSIALADISTRTCSGLLEIVVTGEQAKTMFDSMKDIETVKWQSGVLSKFGSSADCYKAQSSYHCLSTQDNFGTISGGSPCGENH